jgi:hypothetical protein
MRKKKIPENRPKMKRQYALRLQLEGVSGCSGDINSLYFKVYL